MDNLTGRIEEVLAEQKVKKSRFADRMDDMGTGKHTVYRVLRNERSPDYKFLVNFVTLTGVNGHWLLTGDGPKYGANSTLQNAALEKAKQAAMDIRDIADKLENLNGNQPRNSE